MRLRVTYPSPSALIDEHDHQMVKGGLLVRGQAPAGLTLFDDVELELAGDFPPLDAGPVVLRGQVVQIVAGVGVAVAFDPAAVAPTVAAARAPAASAPSSPPARPANEMAQKIHVALHGNKDDRMRVLRDTNKMFHPYVLRNPGLGLDEVLAIAKMSTVAPDLLGTIAANKDWARRPDIAIALVRNPKTPTPAAVRLLDHVSAADLRQLAKDTHTRPPVQQAARKKLLGGA